jgi:uncharacterized caspase-like protein
VRRLLVLTLFLTLSAALPAYAAQQRNLAPDDGKRAALIIGNNGYKSIPQLDRAVNDAQAMAAALQRIGFTTRLLTDATQKQMNKAINEFAENIAGGGVGVMFFAGHGVQINNQNFLLPVDIEDPQRDSDVEDQAVSLQGIQEKLAEVHAKFALMVIDACRDNPLPHKAGRGIGRTRGLSEPTAPNGQMIIFSAGANETALDSLSPTDRDPNGLFTREFLPVLNQPGLSVSDALKAVRTRVIAKAAKMNHDQHPAIYDQTDGDFYLVPGTLEARSSSTSESGQVPSSAFGTAAPVGRPGADEDEALWTRIKESKQLSDYDLYLQRFPNGRYADAARAALHGSAWVADAKTGCKVWLANPHPGAKLTWSGGCLEGLAEGSGTSEVIDGERRTVGQVTKKMGRNNGPSSVKYYDKGHLVRSDEGVTQVMGDGKIVFNGKRTFESRRDNVISQEGRFVDDSLVDGTMKYRDGSEERCQLAEGLKKTGVCHFKGSDGYTYDGDYKNGSQTGHAKIHLRDHSDYEGAVEDGKANGYGKMTYANGDTYEGDWQSGKQHGKGAYVGKDGCRYVGDYVDGKSHGQGVLTCPNGRRQEGTWIAGVFSGPQSSQQALSDTPHTSAPSIVQPASVAQPAQPVHKKKPPPHYTAFTQAAVPEEQRDNPSGPKWQAYLSHACIAAAGVWRVSSSITLELLGSAPGQAVWTPSPSAFKAHPAPHQGVWVCVSDAERRIELRWSDGGVNTVTLSSDGRTLSGDKTEGTHWSAVRAD